MKKWNAPQLEELDVNMTMSGTNDSYGEKVMEKYVGIPENQKKLYYIGKGKYDSMYGPS